MIATPGVVDGRAAPRSTPLAFDAAGHQTALRVAAEQLRAAAAARTGPVSGASPAELNGLTAAIPLLPEHGQDLAEVLARLGGLLLQHTTDLTHPWCAAHLQPPPLPAAVAADALISAVNPSLDAWDLSPIATHLECRIIAGLAAEVGFDPATADGTVTLGGTQSNLMGLLLARDAAAARAGRPVPDGALDADAGRWRILCSEVAHHSVRRAAWILGLGTSAVVPVAVDHAMRLDPGALDRALQALAADGLEPTALIATAGSTDFGSVDPLPELAVRARRHGLWLHVDATVGGALLFSSRRGLLDGLAEADSVALDPHKLLWQPAACGVFLVRDHTTLQGIDHQVAYLNEDTAELDGAEPPPQLLGKSLATTRRLDAFKLLVSFHVLGRTGVAARLDRLVELTTHAAAAVDATPGLLRVHDPVMTSLVFRYTPAGDDPTISDRLNDTIRAVLLRAGVAVIGRTRLAGRVHLKLTLLNPDVTFADLDRLVDLISQTGVALEATQGSA
jgi:L-2,4-diaminobutyrate decarboxylase